MQKTLLRLGFILTLPFALLSAQTPQKFDSGPYKGFTKSATEHVVVELPESLSVRSLQGSITGPHKEDVLPGVVLEIRDESGMMRSGVSDSRGRFHIRGVRKGTYRFKVTKDGFSSIVGTVVLTRAASQKSTITLQMAIAN